MYAALTGFPTKGGLFISLVIVRTLKGCHRTLTPSFSATPLDMVWLKADVRHHVSHCFLHSLGVHLPLLAHLGLVFKPGCVHDPYRHCPSGPRIRFSFPVSASAMALWRMRMVVRRRSTFEGLQNDGALFVDSHQGAVLIPCSCDCNSRTVTTVPSIAVVEPAGLNVRLRDLTALPGRAEIVGHVAHKCGKAPYFCSPEPREP